MLDFQVSLGAASKDAQMARPGVYIALPTSLHPPAQALPNTAHTNNSDEKITNLNMATGKN
jgi:hypothetical protein